MNYQYKLVGAPERGTRRRGTKTGSERVAAAMQEIVAQHAQEGWEYLRTDTLPVSEPRGFLGGRREVMRAVLVFRRAVRQSPAVPESFVADGPSFSAESPPLTAPPREPEPAPRAREAGREAGRDNAREPAREPGFRSVPQAPLEQPPEQAQPPRDNGGRPFRSPYRDDPPPPPTPPSPPRNRLFERPAGPGSDGDDEGPPPDRNPRDLSDIREALRKLDR
ncbi:MAG: hypothetical protein AAFP17_05520 [Pseudomonadota bacterium]